MLPMRKVTASSSTFPTAQSASRSEMKSFSSVRCHGTPRRQIRGDAKPRDCSVSTALRAYAAPNQLGRGAVLDLGDGKIDY